MSKYKSRKFLSTGAVFIVGLFVAATDISVSEVEMVDAVGTWIALGAPLVFVVTEAMIDRMASILTAQQQVLKFQTENIEIRKQYVELQEKHGVIEPASVAPKNGLGQYI